MPLKSNGIALFAILLTLAAGQGCDYGYPEVVITNSLGSGILVKNPSFNGCIWNEVLAYGESTISKSCLPGFDRIHFERFDVGEYVDDIIDAGMEVGLAKQEPTWFCYQTISVKRSDKGAFCVFEISSDDIEQDFSVPGPYGH